MQQPLVIEMTLEPDHAVATCLELFRMVAECYDLIPEWNEEAHRQLQEQTEGIAGRFIENVRMGQREQA